MFLLLVFIAIYLIMDGIWAKRKEGKYSKSILSFDLGIIFMIVVIGCIVCRQLGWYWYRYILIFAYTLIVLSFILFVWNHFLNRESTKNYHAILVLGCGLLDGDRVPNILKSRLDKGIFLYQEKPCKIIVSGGQGKDETQSEAYAMKEYIISKGISRNDIIEENQATSTMENMMFAKRFLKDHEPCIIVSSDYHLLRSYLCAKKAGILPILTGSKTASYYFLSAFIREILIIFWMYKVFIFSFFLLMLIIINC